MQSIWIRRLGLAAFAAGIYWGFLFGDPSHVSAAKGSPGKPSPGVTRIVDSTGLTVGELIGTYRRGSGTEDLPLIYADVALQVNGQSFVVTVDKNRFYGNIELYFSGANCTGQAYFSQQKIDIGARLFPPIGVHPGTNVAYTPNMSANATAISPLSSTRFDGNGRIFAVCQPAAISLVDAIEAIAIGDLSAFYNPPFKIQIAP